MKAVEFMLVVLLVKLLAITNAIAPSDGEPPKIIEGPLHTTVVDGSTVILKCHASGNPKPTIIWEANGHTLLSRKFQVLPSGDLKIENIYFYESGEYTCKAANGYGTVKESARLEVKEKTRIFTESHLKKVGVGQTATFRCDERHDESLSIELEWLKDGEPIDYDKQERYSKLADNSLSISNTIGQDSGEYTCVVRTDVDEDRAVTTLVVQDVPNGPIIEEVICDGLRAEIIWKPQGDNRSPIMSYHVEYNTSFTPQNWEVGQSRVHSNYTKYTYTMSPGATYSFRVIAHNRKGLSPPSKHSKTCTTPPDVPHKNPENVQTEAGHPTNLVITWTPIPEAEHGGPKLHYRVFWKRDIPDAEWESKDVFNWQENKVVISGQPMFVKFLVKVLAINELGESKIPAEEVIGYSGEDRPLLAPKNFKMFTLQSSTSALLKWDPVNPESLQGHFKGYKLQTWTADEGEEFRREFQVDNDTTEILFTYLKPYSKNFIRLCAYNSRFDGPGSVISFDTPEGLPSGVQNLKAYTLSTTDMLLTWDKPLNPNGRLTGYKVYYEEIQGSYLGNRLDSYMMLHDPEVTSGRLQHLRPGKKYRITVVAKTAMGEGNESFIEGATLRRSIKPHEPSEPNFKWEPLISVKVLWQPFNGEPTGTHFFTQYRVKGQTEWHNTHEEKDDVYQIIGGLSSNTIYEFRIVSVYGKYQKESEIQEIKTF